MHIEELKIIFIRDLDQLEQEIALYPEESKLWIVKGEISNSGGNLCLHITGNLQHYIGAVLGKTDYVRNRDAEFSEKNVPRAKLIELVKRTKQIVDATLEKMTDDDLSKIFPIQFLAKHPAINKDGLTTGFYLTHLATHLNYHLGQINYHRRMG
jgi:uncharacterized damage-inducible protein DinB